ncbi:hypothetical protein [Burkholderia sp. Ac-20349]|uniref:hypothetical protein n=1 Tax=Burkholderia sp. Ac-20349 TaxID=2703893 RepID=UPI001F1216CC|nr:hypothetical protein [Burkholderia sp. Ac-20349]
MVWQIGAALGGLVANLAGFSTLGGLADAQHAAVWLSATFAAAPLLAAVVARRVVVR